jgi:hypothetical protein
VDATVLAVAGSIVEVVVERIVVATVLAVEDMVIDHKKLVAAQSLVVVAILGLVEVVAFVSPSMTAL